MSGPEAPAHVRMLLSLHWSTHLLPTGVGQGGEAAVSKPQGTGRNRKGVSVQLLVPRQPLVATNQGLGIQLAVTSSHPRKCCAPCLGHWGHLVAKHESEKKELKRLRDSFQVLEEVALPVL